MTEVCGVDISLRAERGETGVVVSMLALAGVAGSCQLMTATLSANMKLKCGIKFKLKNFFQTSNHFDPNFSKAVEAGGRQSDKNPVLTSFSCLDTPVLSRNER